MKERSRSAMLKKIQGAQMLARFIEAATAEGGHELPACVDSLAADLPFAPREAFVIKRARRRIFILQHRRPMLHVPVVLRGQDARAEHVQEAMHFRLHA